MFIQVCIMSPLSMILSYLQNLFLSIFLKIYLNDVKNAFYIEVNKLITPQVEAKTF